MVKSGGILPSKIGAKQGSLPLSRDRKEVKPHDQRHVLGYQTVRAVLVRGATPYTQPCSSFEERIIAAILREDPHMCDFFDGEHPHFCEDSQI